MFDMRHFVPYYAVFWLMTFAESMKIPSNDTNSVIADVILIYLLCLLYIPIDILHGDSLCLGT